MLIMFKGFAFWISPRVGLPLTLLCMKVYNLL